MATFTKAVASRFVSPCEQEQARLWARFDCLAHARHNLRNAQEQLAKARSMLPAGAVSYWEQSVCRWLDAVYRAQNNVDVYRAFADDCANYTAY